MWGVFFALYDFTFNMCRFWTVGQTKQANWRNDSGLGVIVNGILSLFFFLNKKLINSLIDIKNNHLLQPYTQLFFLLPIVVLGFFYSVLQVLCLFCSWTQKVNLFSFFFKHLMTGWNIFIVIISYFIVILCQNYYIMQCFWQLIRAETITNSVVSCI